MNDLNFLVELRKIFGEENMITSKEKLKKYSFDKCPRDLFYKFGHFKVNDKWYCLAVVRPSKKNYEKELCQLISLAKKYGKKIVPRGGGSGVCGAVVPREGQNTVVVDITSLNMIDKVRPLKRHVVVGAGILGSELENFLNRCYFRTLGHSPASLSISTPGGWVATRSSGQFSSRYGTIEELVSGIEVITADCKLRWLSGRDLKSFFRMEGTTGIITKIKMQIFPFPRDRRFFALSFKNLDSAFKVMQLMFQKRSEFEQRGVALVSLRLYDPFDYRFVAKPFKSRKENSKKEKKFKMEKMLMRHPRIVNFLIKVLEKKSILKPIMLLVFESDSSIEIDKAVSDLGDICDAEGNVNYEGTEIAETWYKNRFKLNYEKLEERFKNEIVVDTFDCRPKDFKSALKMYRAIRDAAKDLVIIGAHFGVDRKGPYIYFTFAGSRKSVIGRLVLYDETWIKIMKACYQNGGFTTHHHGIGYLRESMGYCDKGELLPFTYDEGWFHNTALPAKKNLDPGKIFNPGNIF